MNHHTTPLTEAQARAIDDMQDPCGPTIYRMAHNLKEFLATIERPPGHWQALVASKADYHRKDHPDWPAILSVWNKLNGDTCSFDALRVLAAHERMSNAD